jgi:transposase-like protein
MSKQYKIFENQNRWQSVKTNKERLQELHATDGMSIFELAYKFDAPVDEVKENLKHFGIHITGPVDWKDDKDVLKKVAEDNAEGEFSDLLSGRVTSRHIKNRVEKYGIKSYEEDHTDKETLREHIDNSESVEEIANTFGVHEVTIEQWSRKHFGKHPKEMINDKSSIDNDSESETSEDSFEFESAEESEDGMSRSNCESSVDIDVEALLERGDVDVEMGVDGSTVNANVTFAVDDIITVEETTACEIVNVEAELKKLL